MQRVLFLLLACFSIYAPGPDTLHAAPQSGELKTAIGNSTIVGLGESSHGFESINRAKAAIAVWLHEELNFKAIAFESSFTASIIAYLERDEKSNRLRNFLYPFWNTPAVQAALQHFLDEEGATSGPLVVGFDLQEDCRFQRFSRYLLEQEIIVTHQHRLRECDSILSQYIGKNPNHNGALSSGEYDALIRNYDAVAAELRLKSMDSLQRKLLEHCLENRKWLCQYLTFSTYRQKMEFRDRTMAANIRWLREEVFLDKKLILWAANSHLAKAPKARAPTWTGEWLATFYPQDYFAISVQKGSAKQRFMWKGTTLEYALRPNDKFDAAVYVQELLKILPQQWETPCD